MNSNLNYQQISELQMMSEKAIRSLPKKFKSIETFCSISVPDSMVESMQELLNFKLSGEGSVTFDFSKKAVIVYLIAPNLYHVGYGTNLLDDLKNGYFKRHIKCYEFMN